MAARRDASFPEAGVRHPAAKGARSARPGSDAGRSPDGAVIIDANPRRCYPGVWDERRKTTMKCAKCQHENPADTSYCGKC
ncbi:MAG: hypothetical protein OEW05_06560, partial [Candidatus Aminicenantes bacterium]|nr:hypothetical protein [Candidatus Aminicenantes bacterium]